MLLLTIASTKGCGGCFVRNNRTSSWLESARAVKVARGPRRGAVGKVLLDSNSLAAYPTI